MTSIKITYIISNIDKARAFEWIADKISNNRFQLSFILLNPDSSDLEYFLKERHIPVAYIPFNGKKDIIAAFISLYRNIKRTKPDIIHCHLFEASLLGLLAGKLAGVKKRIYTRHHSTYNWEYNAKGVKYDRWINYLATDIVAISENVKNVLVARENVPPQKVCLIHHGFDLEAFQNIEIKRITFLKEKYSIANQKPVIGVVARWIEWKGIQYIIPAFKMILKKYPKALLVLANANGPYKNEIQNLLNDLPEENCRIIRFENDLFALYQLFDIYIHTPVNEHIEAFGQTYIEALAAGKPSIFTLSGIAKEFIEHEKNALIVPYNDHQAIEKYISQILHDNVLTRKLIDSGKKSILKFDLPKMINLLMDLYEKK